VILTSTRTPQLLRPLVRLEATFFIEAASLLFVFPVEFEHALEEHLDLFSFESGENASEGVHSDALDGLDDRLREQADERVVRLDVFGEVGGGPGDA
jgi:hypothetical protein